MNRRQFGKSMILGGAVAVFPFIAKSQPKHIRIVVPFTPGSGSDDGARYYADLLSKVLNRTVIVENKPGASGAIAVRTVLSEPADGNTILLGSNSLIAVNSIVTKDLGYDPFKDLTPLHGVGISSAAYTTGGESPYETVADLKVIYDKNSVPLSIGNYSEGYRLLAEWLSQETKVPIINVPYRGGAQLITDVIGGRLNIGLSDITGLVQSESAKKIKILAITGNERDHLIPHVPTMLELGLPIESYVWSSFSMKNGTSQAILTELAQAITEVQKTPEAQKYHAARAGKPLTLSLGDLGDFQKLENERFKKVAEKANIKPM